MSEASVPAVARGLHGLEELLDDVLGALREVHELEAGLIGKLLLLDVADLAVCDAALHDERLVVQGQPELVEQVELECERGLDTRAGHAEVLH